MTTVRLLRGHTFHGRKGAVENGFRYSIDYVLLDAENRVDAPRLFARNRAGLMSLQDADHGGPPRRGRGAPWAREVLAAHGLTATRLMLLAQPRLLGHVFNPVSFWLAYEGDVLRAVIAEVTNTFGDRHSYLCTAPGGRAIKPEDRIEAQKILHVSPFQPIAGGYVFQFDIRAGHIGIRIDYSHAKGGVVATLVGPVVPLSSWGILRSALRRPFGARRVVALIHWQALKLWWKGASYRPRPEAPGQEVTGAPGQLKEAS